MKKVQNIFISFLTLALVWCMALPAAAAEAGAGVQKTVKIGFFSADGYHVMNDDGIMSGYGYDFLQMLLRYNDWSYDYIGYDKNWGDMLAMLDDGTIDMVTLANKTPEREEKYAYSEKAIGNSATIITVAASNESIVPGEYAGYDGKIVGLVAGSSHNAKFESYAAEKGFTYTPVYYDDIADLLADLRAGKNGLDMAVTSNMRVVSGEVILDEFDQTPYYAIVRKDDAALLQELDSGIAQMDVYSPEWRSDLFNKYYADINSEVLALSAEERAYLKQLQDDGTVLKAAMNPELGPYAYFANGEPQGIVPEIFREIAGRLGIRYEILYAADRTAYKQLLQSGAADIDLTAYQDFGIAQKYGLKETDAYLTSCLAMVTRAGSAVNTAEMTVAAVDDPTEYAAYNSDLIYKNESKQYTSLQECVDAVKDGACDATFLYAYSAEQVVSADYTHKLQYTILPKYNFGLTLGVQNALDHRLLSVLNKAVESLSASYTQSVTLEEITRQQHEVTLGSLLYSQPLLVVLVAVALVALLGAVAVAVVVYRNQRRVRLANNKLNRFVGYVCEDYDLVTEMDLKNRVRTDYAMQDGRLVEKTYPYVPLVAEDYAKIAHPEDIDKILATSDEATVGKMIDEGGQHYFEVQIKDATGAYRWYSYLLRAVAKDEGHPRNYIMFKRDIQATKDATARQQQNLQDALRAAKTASAAKGQFLSRMSHEIRTPLNAIIGYMELAKDAETPEKVRHCVENTDLAAQHLLSIINDVLDISAIESGRMKVAHEEFNLKDMITALSTLFYNQAREKGVKFDVQLKGITCEWAVGDKLRVNQVLMNLLSNALKFTPAGGSVTLRIDQRRKEGGKIFLQFDVADTGIGMSKEFMSRLFQSFEQENATTAQKYGGTGLGLSIARNLVEMMGGSVDVASEQGKGSTFTVLLHFDESTTHHENDTPLDFSHVRVLVVDDEKDEGAYVKTTLKRCGVRADVVADGAAAIKRIRSRAGGDYAYDLCIMDWKMPGMNGVETAAKIREEFGGTLPIIIATAYDAHALEDEAKAAGANRVVAKPLFQSTLFDLLAVTFGKRQPQQAEAPAQKTRDLHGVRLLLAEDNAMNMEIAVTVLEKAGATVTQAVDGEEACKAFLNAPAGTFDMILMDIQMPVMDGYAATRKIRQSSHPEAGSIPIVAMTANAFAEDVAQALTSGMNAHIAKPVNYDKLYEVMNTYHIGEEP